MHSDDINLKLINFKNISNADLSLLELIRKWRNSRKVRKFMYTDHWINKKEHTKWYNSINLKNSRKKAWTISYNEIPIGLVYLSELIIIIKLLIGDFILEKQNLETKESAQYLFID